MNTVLDNLYKYNTARDIYIYKYINNNNKDNNNNNNLNNNNKKNNDNNNDNNNLNNNNSEGSTVPSFEKYFDKPMESSIYLSNCDTDEINAIISELNSNKSSDLPITVIKKCAHIISPIISKFINAFMEKGIFPEILKVGRVTPIYKKGNPQIFDNYRPVSTLPLFGKIFEKVIYSRLYNYLGAKNILYDKQFGLRKNHSTSHAINYSVNKISKELERGRHIIGIFIDLSKAFDTIDHSKLLCKLYNYGIRGTCHNLIKDYLSQRHQYTHIFNEDSDKDKIVFGVPQGSVLGPLLFLIYINDIVNSSTLGGFVLFADDTNIFIVGNDNIDAFNKANKVLSDIYTYMRSNQLHINMGKCAYMYFRPKPSKNESLSAARTRPVTEHLVLAINGIKIAQVQKIKFLGVIIDENLTWDDQISYLENKLKSCLVLIKRIKKYIPQNQYINIYHSLFLSHLTYAISSWGGVAKYKLNKIFSIQKRCIRILFGKKVSFDDSSYYETCARTRPYVAYSEYKNFCLEHTKPLFNEHNLLTVHNLYIKHTFIETFKILKFRSPYSLYSDYNIKQKTNYRLSRPNIRLKISQNNFLNKSCCIWNLVIDRILEKDKSCDRGYIVPGNTKNSDLTATISFVKKKIVALLRNAQKLGCNETWEDINFSP